MSPRLHPAAPPVYRPSAPQIQTKVASPAGSAPPVYRPVQAAAQPKISSLPSRTGIPEAPPAYRPSAPPIQAKVASRGAQFHPGTAPSVYSPRQTATVQAKIPSLPSLTRIPAPPPVYRPAPPASVQAKMPPAAPLSLPGTPFQSLLDNRNPNAASPSVGHNDVIQAKATLYKDSAGNYQIGGRPDFTSQLKREVFDKADDDGEEYIVQFSDNNGVSFRFPTVHRRHKLAWSLWRAAVNTILANGNEAEMTNLMKQCFVPPEWKKWTQKEFEDARDDGDYLVDLADDFFNHKDNLWLGPGDENIGKGGGLDKQIDAYVKNPSKTRRQRLKESAFDPHNKSEFEYRPPDPTTGERGDWYYYNIPQTPLSHQMEDTTDYILDKVLK